MFAREACLPEPTGFRAALEWSARALSYGTLSAARANLAYLLFGLLEPTGLSQMGLGIDISHDNMP